MTGSSRYYPAAAGLDHDILHDDHSSTRCWTFRSRRISTSLVYRTTMLFEEFVDRICISRPCSSEQGFGLIIDWPMTLPFSSPRDRGNTLLHYLIGWEQKRRSRTCIRNKPISACFSMFPQFFDPCRTQLAVCQTRFGIAYSCQSVTVHQPACKQLACWAELAHPWRIHQSAANSIRCCPEPTTLVINPRLLPRN